MNNKIIILFSCYHLAVKTVHNRPNYFAERLHAAMKGVGTDDDALIRIIVRYKLMNQIIQKIIKINKIGSILIVCSRCEIDLANIKYEYERAHGKTLLSVVKVIYLRSCI